MFVLVVVIVFVAVCVVVLYLFCLCFVFVCLFLFVSVRLCPVFAWLCLFWFCLFSLGFLPSFSPRVFAFGFSSFSVFIPRGLFVASLRALCSDWLDSSQV